MSRAQNNRPVIQRLPEEMGLLLPTGASPGWVAAVTQAGRILAFVCTSNSRLPLRTLALVVYALAHEGGEEAAGVSVEAVRRALADGTDGDGGTEALEGRIRAVLPQEQGGREPAVVRVFRESTYREEPLEGDYGPGPSEVTHGAQRLAALLEGHDGSLLPAPVPAGPVAVTVTGTVRTVRYGVGSVAAMMPVLCEACGEREGSTVAVDGPDVTYTCAQGHTTSPPPLAAVHVRAALAAVRAGQAAVTGPSTGTEDTLLVHGDLGVAWAGMREDANALGGPLGFMWTADPSSS